MEIKIDNLDRIIYAFSIAPEAMHKNLNTAIKKTILNIQGQSMRNTPVLTGRLRASTSSNFGDLKASVGTNTNYDVFVHYGTRYMKARPYLSDAIEQKETETLDYFTEAVMATLNKIAGIA